MSTIVIAAIQGYKRYVSPYKGYRCAHSTVHGHGSCSSFGVRAYGRYRFVAATKLLIARFRECREAARGNETFTMTQGAAPERPSRGSRRYTRYTDLRDSRCYPLADIAASACCCAFSPK